MGAIAKYSNTRNTTRKNTKRRQHPVKMSPSYHYDCKPEIKK